MGDGIHDGNYTSLTVTNSGLSIDISRSSGVGFDVLNDNLGGFPDAFPSPGWDDQALSPFFDPNINDFFVANMSSSVEIFGVQYGDFGGDADTVFLNAWSGLNGTGILLDSVVGSFTGDFNMLGAGDGPEDLVVFGTGIQSVTFGGGSVSAPHSIFFDNFRVSFTPVPEPATSGSLLVLAVATSLSRRRR